MFMFCRQSDSFFVSDKNCLVGDRNWFFPRYCKSSLLSFFFMNHDIWPEFTKTKDVYSFTVTCNLRGESCPCFSMVSMCLITSQQKPSINARIYFWNSPCKFSPSLQHFIVDRWLFCSFGISTVWWRLLCNWSPQNVLVWDSTGMWSLHNHTIIIVDPRLQYIALYSRYPMKGFMHYG